MWAFYMINILHVKPDLKTTDWQGADRIGRYDEYGRRYLVDLTLKFSRPDRQSAVPFRSSGGPAGGGLSALT